MSELTNQLHRILNKTEKPIIKYDGHWYSTAELKSDMARVQNYLQQAGLQPGDRVLLGLPNSYRFAVIYLAVIEYGATVVSMNPAMPKSEFYLYIERSCPAIAFADQEHASWLFEDMPQNCSLKSVFVLKSSQSELQWYQLCQSNWSGQPLIAEGKPFVSHSPEEDTIAVILYTSGTTGTPKAVGLAHRQVYAAAQNVIQAHYLTSADVTYEILPLFHINAQVIAFLSTILSDGKIVLVPKFSASKFWKTVVEDKITWVSAVPTIISILLKIDRPEQIPESFRFIRSASAKLQPADARMFQQKFHIPLIEAYGMTEAAGQICTNPLPPRKQKVGSAGLPVGLELKIVGDDDKELKPFETGEIALRGNNVITKYLQAENQNDFRNGWFHTGDVGYVDEEGYLFIVGRKKELINHGGEKISPYEVEDVISQLSAVDQAAVIGLPDPLYGEKVTAFVTANRKLLQELGTVEALKNKITNQCKDKLSVFKCPEEVYVVETLPTGPTGKLQRNLLKQTYQDFITGSVTDKKQN